MTPDLAYPSVRPTRPLVAGVMLTAIALQVGTGGAATAEYYMQRGLKGYPLAHCVPIEFAEEPIQIRTLADDLQHIRAVLKPAVTDLALAFGVSRQAIYDWQAGKPVAAHNAARIEDLARAADVFAAEGLTGSAQLLRRPIISGKPLFHIVRDGGSAEIAAKMLVAFVGRELRQRQSLAGRLEGRKRPSVPSEDLGAPMLDEVG